MAVNDEELLDRQNVLNDGFAAFVPNIRSVDICSAQAELPPLPIMKIAFLFCRFDNKIFETSSTLFKSRESSAL